MGEIYPSPLGVVSSLSSKGATVVTSGTVNPAIRLVPGKEYYGNSNGKLIEGDYTGHIDSISYPLYAHNNEIDQILTREGIVGMALSEDQLFVGVVDRKTVFHVCVYR